MAETAAFDLLDKRMVTDQLVLTVGYDTASLTDPAIRNKYKGEVTADRIVNPDLLVRRLNLTTNRVIRECDAVRPAVPVQYDLFTDIDAVHRQEEKEKTERDKERRAQEAVLKIRKQFGKNAILKGMNFEEGATAIQRNGQIGGHKA